MANWLEARTLFDKSAVITRDKEKRFMTAKILKLLGLLALIALIYGLFSARDSSDRLSSHDTSLQTRKATEERITRLVEEHIPTPGRSYAYILARLDAGYELTDADSVAVRWFRDMLDDLETKYSENRAEITDRTVYARALLRKEGIQISLRQLFEGMDRLYSEGKLDNLSFDEEYRPKYVRYIMLYIMNRKNGQSHSKAIDELKAMLRRMDDKSKEIQPQ
mgnify:FL=1